MNRFATIIGVVLIILAAVLYFVANIHSNPVIILGVLGLLVAIYGLATGR